MRDDDYHEDLGHDPDCDCAECCAEWEREQRRVPLVVLEQPRKRYASPNGYDCGEV